MSLNVFHPFWLVQTPHTAQQDPKKQLQPRNIYKHSCDRSENTGLGRHSSHLLLKQPYAQTLTTFPAGDGIMQLSKEPSVNLNRLSCKRRTQKSWELEIRSWHKWALDAFYEHPNRSQLEVRLWMGQCKTKFGHTHLHIHKNRAVRTSFFLSLS